MLTGRGTLNFIPNGGGYLPLSPWALGCILGFLYTAPLISGRFLVAHTLSPKLLFSLLSTLKAQYIDRHLALSKTQNEKLPFQRPLSRFGEVLSKVLDEKHQETTDADLAPILVFHLSNSGQNPDVEVFPYAPSVQRFLKRMNAQRFRRSWDALVRSFWVGECKRGKLHLPPLSTLHGLLAAAYGSYNLPEPLAIGYLFHAEPRSSYDLEKLWFLAVEDPTPPTPPTKSDTPTSTKPKKASKSSAPQKVKIKEFKSNVLYRELRVNFTLELFLQTPDLALWQKILRSPRYWLSLGRSQELLSVEEITEVQPEPIPPSLDPPLYAGPGLYPFTWKDWLEPQFSAQRLPAYIPPIQRKPVLWGYFLELTAPLRLLAPESEEKQKERAALLANKAWVVPTHLPGPTHRRVVYFWSLNPIGSLAESLRAEWPQS